MDHLLVNNLCVPHTTLLITQTPPLPSTRSVSFLRFVALISTESTHRGRICKIWDHRREDETNRSVVRRWSRENRFREGDDRISCCLGSGKENMMTGWSRLRHVAFISQAVAESRLVTEEPRNLCDGFQMFWPGANRRQLCRVGLRSGNTNTQRDTYPYPKGDGRERGKGATRTLSLMSAGWGECTSGQCDL